VSIYYSQFQSGGYVIEINRDTRTLTLYRGGAAIRTYPVAVGKRATPTPLGNYSIIEKKMNPGGPFGARWMRFYAGYGIHGTNNPSSIGKAVSNGCVRMYNSAAMDLYSKVSVGTPVRIIGSPSRVRELALGIAPGNDIMRLQELLRKFGYYTGSVHGFYDQATMQSTAAFQYASGITVDGIVGWETWGALQKYYAILHNDMQT
jgi:L,D-transpeptidase ErfK/SrfK